MQDPFIIFVTDPEREDTPVALGLTRIGRSSSSEIQINDANVSKAHCILIRTGEGVVIYDFSSRNGTFVGREKACGQYLKDGDEIVLGEHWRLMYMEGQSSTAKKSSEENVSALLEEPSREKPKLGYVLPWVIAVLCAIFAFIPREEKLKDENAVGDLRKKLSKIENEVATYKKQIAENEHTTAALQTKIEDQQQQIAQQKRQVEKKQNLLSLTQGQLRLVRKQRDRLLQKRKNTNKDVSENGIDNEDKAVLVEETKDIENTEPEEELTEEKTVVEVPEKKDIRENKEPKIAERSYDLDALAKKLITILESYAFPSISSQSLQPMLSQLSGSSSLKAAKKMLELVEYSESLNHDLNKNITFLEKRVQKLLDLAKQKQNMSRDDLEKHQRLLELSQKKAEIQKKQQQRLLTLQNSIVDDFTKLQDPEMTKYLVKKLNKRDETRSLAILNALTAAKAEHAIPKLMATLTTKNTVIRDKIIATLSQITSLPFSNVKEWKSWWSKQQNK
ncbi:FHA domain-containing protein [Candidatus Uabimicrobium amorphum]|uniref:FHA domain-containing protein n=1 Tax=Uabimicrobium amorphum TaxID=2596890 RepID=A0A5S9F265_UABAM|nr:FHA domain-containing protein [Candidatus Uabimicrobium amorphum]BBM82921.1 FHA domain-containing protein [Candidatus Uabimicrobium amorphum]